MHELGLAHGIVELVQTAAEAEGVAKVAVVHVQVGRLAGVEAGALLFSFEIAAEGTRVAGARLHITDVPVAIWCAACNAERELAGVNRFRCPVCETPSGDIRRGKELEVTSIEVEQ
ncbi:hydrogenase maturation nickel metallochaperone HypA [Gemmatimonas sp.]|uniref:hydrogenase maturation nickel metallochaperone HypA n=1 Tax=Gemmatimonas sp. TaxID=1962908 RepID=UPI0025BA7747|nr:hydrogenase maturation nickel metallochaperone HypA [Gemmatimonas sp.]MCA2989757.1 hydrogenase maturation nickel metallochaperone HypA [Gemmatimonas sp.]